VATTVIVFGVPATNAIDAEADPLATVVPLTVIVPVPVGVTVMLLTLLAMVIPGYV
jgi:hypothetical protein